jgi:hypothetical protein
MFTKYNSSLLRDKKVNQYAFFFVESVSSAALSVSCTCSLIYCPKITAKFTPPLPSRYLCAQVMPSRESITNDLALVWAEVGQPCFKNDCVGRSDVECKRKIYRR